MNIAKIHSMVKQGDLSNQAIRYLLDCHGECEHLDYKETIDFSSERDSINIVKDMLAFHNIGGGYILFGVKDKSWDPIGLPKSLGMDTKQIRDIVQKYANIDLDVDYVEHEINILQTKKRFGVILISASAKPKKLGKPVMCKKTTCSHEKWALRDGETFIRDGDSTRRLNDFDELAQKLEDLELMYEEAENSENNDIPSPYKIEDGLYRILPPEYEGFVGREDLLVKVKNSIEKDKRIWIINLFGPGGVGKSAIATRIAYDFYESNSFEAILHLSAKDRELSVNEGIRALKPSLISLEDLLDRILRLFSYDECCENSLEGKKTLVNELLSAWKTLIILDNMETVDDGRIMDFITEFPDTTKAKVLLTSRQRSRTWEMPVQVPQLSYHEVHEFIKIRCGEMNLDFPIDDQSVISKIEELSGGLPLAIQWILGDYARTHDLGSILDRVLNKNSPLLEFSFRNSWTSLSGDAQKALAVLPIFLKPPTQQEWRMILNWNNEKIEESIGELVQSTFISKQTNEKSGENVYNALPITLSFAKNELSKLGTLGIDARNRFEEYRQRLDVATAENQQNEGLFIQFDAKTDNQKLAIQLSKIAEGQLSSLGYEEAEDYFKQAISTDPNSVFALVKYARFNGNMQETEKAEGLFEKAISRLTKKTGFFVYLNYAEYYGDLRQWRLKVKYLLKALEYKNYCRSYEYVMAQHSLGIAYGQLRDHESAIKVFDEIIENELLKPYGPSKSLVVAARTKKISLKRLNRQNANAFIEELINRCSSTRNPERIIEELQKIAME
ncbi:MAG: hypothetical protein GYA58_12705 [Anaerolineaceae bacterium]|nr:hypothetical protein [Anaerolineaceae bacterium]